MGFSFLRIEEELASERFTSFYRRFQKECPRLAVYPSTSALIAFFNDVEQEYAEKDALLSFLITAYRRDGPGRLLSGFFIILFRPSIAALYRLARKRDSRLDEEEFIQEVCALLLEIIATAPIRPRKVAMQIVGPLRNRVRSLMNRELGRDSLETYWPAAGEGEGNAAPDGDYDYGLPTSDKDEIPDLPLGEQGEQRESGKWQRFDLADAGDFLDNLVAAGVICAEDREVIYETVIKERPLKDLASDPSEYQRLKKRRQRSLLAIREHLRNSSK